MGDDGTLANRLDELEARVAFQDRTIEELNAVVTNQWRVIDDLLRQVAQLREHAQATNLVADPRSEPPPPHY